MNKITLIKVNNLSFSAKKQNIRVKNGEIKVSECYFPSFRSAWNLILRKLGLYEFTLTQKNVENLLESLEKFTGDVSEDEYISLFRLLLDCRSLKLTEDQLARIVKVEDQYYQKSLNIFIVDHKLEFSRKSKEATLYDYCLASLIKDVVRTPDTTVNGVIAFEQYINKNPMYWDEKALALAICRFQGNFNADIAPVISSSLGVTTLPHSMTRTKNDFYILEKDKMIEVTHTVEYTPKEGADKIFKVVAKFTLSTNFLNRFLNVNIRDDDEMQYAIGELFQKREIVEVVGWSNFVLGIMEAKKIEDNL